MDVAVVYVCIILDRGVHPGHPLLLGDGLLSVSNKWGKNIIDAGADNDGDGMLNVNNRQQTREHSYSP